jgi:hypothetical protein
MGHTVSVPLGREVLKRSNKTVSTSGVLLHGGPRVRILLPPAAGQRRTRLIAPRAASTAMTLFDGGPMVRILLPPPASLRTPGPTEEGIGGFIAIRDQTPGLRIGRRERLGLRGIPEAEILFQDMEVTVDALVLPPRGLTKGFADLTRDNRRRVGRGAFGRCGGVSGGGSAQRRCQAAAVP